MNYFGCHRCGNCCRVEGYVLLRAGEADAIASHLDIPVREFTARYTSLTRDRRGLSLAEHADGSCVFLDGSGSCMVHASKPRQCVDFPAKWHYAGCEGICGGAPTGPAEGR